MSYIVKQHDPRCYYCGKPLKRSTESHYHGKNEHYHGFTGTYRSKAEVEAARITNHKVMSVRKDRTTGVVWTFNTWDGESYVDDMFCTDRCGYLMGRMGVRAGLRRANRENRKEAV